MSRREGIIWAAGLFEGEGSLTTKPAPEAEPGTRGGWAMQLSSTDEDVVRRFASIVGCGTVYGPYTNKGRHAQGRWRPYWKWACQARDQVYGLLAKLYPFLGSRRRARAAEAMADLPPVQRMPRNWKELTNA